MNNTRSNRTPSLYFILLSVALIAAIALPSSLVYAKDNPNCEPPTTSDPAKFYSIEIGLDSDLPSSDTGKISSFRPNEAVTVFNEGLSDSLFDCGTDNDEAARIDFASGQTVYVGDGYGSSTIDIIADENGEIHFTITALETPGSMFVHIKGEQAPYIPVQPSCEAWNVQPTEGLAPLTVFGTGSFSDPDNLIKSTYIEWGDGFSSKTGLNPAQIKHEYTNSGTFTSQLVLVKKDTTLVRAPECQATVVVNEVPEKDIEEISAIPLCTTPGAESDDLEITGAYRVNGVPKANMPVEIDSPNGMVLIYTDALGNYSFLFTGAKNFIGSEVVIKAGKAKTSFIISMDMFDECQAPPEEKQVWCHNVFMFDQFGQPLKKDIPFWGIEDVVIDIKGFFQSARLLADGEVILKGEHKQNQLIVPKLRPGVKYQIQVKGFGLGWTNVGCEFTFGVLGGGHASLFTDTSDSPDKLTINGQSVLIKPINSACGAWNEACRVTPKIITVHLDDDLGDPMIGSRVRDLQVGDSVYIHEEGLLYTYRATAQQIFPSSIEGYEDMKTYSNSFDVGVNTCTGTWSEKDQKYSDQILVGLELVSVESLHRYQ